MTMTDMEWEELEAAGLCECGQVLEDHTPLLRPKPWAEGRPCNRSALDRGRGWDGRVIPERTLKSGNLKRWATR